jgi:hypothetical protein
MHPSEPCPRSGGVAASDRASRALVLAARSQARAVVARGRAGRATAGTGRGADAGGSPPAASPARSSNTARREVYSFVCGRIFADPISGEVEHHGEALGAAAENCMSESKKKGTETDMWGPCGRGLNPHLMCLQPNKKPERAQPRQPNKKPGSPHP